MALVLNTAPADEPVTRAEQALFMRYIGSLQNDVIDALITAARKQVEQWTGRTLITTTWDYYTDQLCDYIPIPTGRIISVSAITYTDNDNATQTLSGSLYEVDNKSVIDAIVQAPNQTYPEALTKPNAVKITFTAGYGAASAVPEDIKTAIKMTAALMYEHRESGSTDTIKPNPAIIDLLGIEAKFQGW